MSHSLEIEPTDPLAAATHANPYPYYARLVAGRPMYRDEHLQLWVACGASAVAEVLSSELCHVRPAAEPVPRALGNSSAAEIFRRLVRMNDGENHCPFKQAIVATLNDIDHAAVLAAVRQRAVALTAELAPHQQRAGLTRFMFTLPVQTIAMLLGVPAARLADATRWVEAFVGGISPIAEAAEVERGSAAAVQLQALFRTLLDEQRAQQSTALLAVLAREASNRGRGADDVIIANGIGLLSQTYEATAGLIGNTLLALARRPEVLAVVRRTPALLANVVHQVLHADPPTQSTRRFVTRAGVVAGQAMQAGDAILVMLAAAGRDPAINPDPDGFEIQRQQRGLQNFGAGVHACPANTLAPLIAEQAVAHLLTNGLKLDGLPAHCTYRRSNHLRMPTFA